MPKRVKYQPPVHDTSADVHRRRQRAPRPPQSSTTFENYPAGTAETQERDQNLMQFLDMIGITPRPGRLHDQPRWNPNDPRFRQDIIDDPSSVLKPGEVKRRPGQLLGEY